MARKIIIIILLLIAALASASLMRVGVPNKAPHSLTTGADPLRISSPLPAPKDIKIELLPTLLEAEYFQISWRRVEGARYYKIYTTVAVPDSSVWLVYAMPTLDQNGMLIWEYKYSFNPTYGDAYTIRKKGGGFDLLMWDKFLVAPWVCVDSTATCTYRYDNVGEVNRFWRVAAVR